jgi:hypothetical protein
MHQYSMAHSHILQILYRLLLGLRNLYKKITMVMLPRLLFYNMLLHTEIGI